nr:MAG TPA: hypothetical protein [Caudoviricetes sp.]
MGRAISHDYIPEFLRAVISNQFPFTFVKSFHIFLQKTKKPPTLKTLW